MCQWFSEMITTAWMVMYCMWYKLISKIISQWKLVVWWNYVDNGYTYEHQMPIKITFVHWTNSILRMTCVMPSYIYKYLDCRALGGVHTVKLVCFRPAFMYEITDWIKLRWSSCLSVSVLSFFSFLPYCSVLPGFHSHGLLFLSH